mgnify:CR=1 FL=1
MLQTFPKNTLALIFLLLFSMYDLSAQKSIAKLKHKKCLLRGKWQLVQTYSDSALHKVEKADYDAVIHFKVFHRYAEEVHYEGNHWIIEGKWHVYRHRASLLLTNRKYKSGSLGDSPKDIHYEILGLTKRNLIGNSTADNKPVKMFYERIKRK